MKRITDYKFKTFGVERRINRMFNEKSGRCLMLAVDHGYFQGVPHGFENLEKVITPLLPYLDCFSPARGGLNQIGPIPTPVILRATGGTSMTRPDELDNEVVTVSIDEMLSDDVEGYSAQIMVSYPRETQMIKNLTDLLQGGNKYGLIALGVCAVGKGTVPLRVKNKEGKYELQDVNLMKIISGEGGEPTPEENEAIRDYLKHSCRVIAENGATIVKTYPCERFEEVVESCLVPVVMAGGKAQDTYKMLETGEKAVRAGVVGFDWGRNIIQNDHPVAMAVALVALLHGERDAKDAYMIYKRISESTGGDEVAKCWYHDLTRK